MNIPENYQLTEAGLIPGEWQAKKLGELFKFKNGVNAEKKQYGKGIKFINVLEVIQKSSLLYDDIPGFISLASESIKTNIVQKGDVLFNRTSETQEEIGLTAVYLDEPEVVFGGFVIRAKPISDLIDCYFSKYGFSSLTVRNQIIKRGQGAIRANIGQSDLKEVFIPLPPLPEQKTIAQSLSDVDALIIECDRLITKKRHIKQGTMQQLLTGKKRLPSFSGEWTVKRVGDICDFIVPGRNKPRNFDGNIPWITTPDLDEGRSVSKSRLGLCISRDEAKNVGSKIVPAGSVIMSCAGELGIVAFTENEIVINQQLHAFIPFSIINSLFLLNAIKGQKKYIDGVATKTAVPYINKDNCNSIPIPFPPLPEQQAIAQILSDMDTEIAAIEQKRDKYKAIKQGMMQELLTGRTRLKYD